MKTYTIYVCSECGQHFDEPYNDLDYDGRPHHARPDGNRLGCRSTKWEPVEVIPRAVADAVVNAVAAELPLLREARGGRQTAVDEPLAKYREAVGECARTRTLEHVESTGERVRRRIGGGSQDA